MQPTPPRERWLVPAALAVVAIKVLLLFVLLPGFQRHSALEYQAVGFPDGYASIATNVVEGRGYRWYPETSLTMVRTPGFVLVLAAIFRFAPMSLPAVEGVQLVFSLLTAWGIARLARRATSSRGIGWLAAIVFLFHPGVVVAESRGGVESTLMLSLVALLEALDLAHRRGGHWRWVLVGLAFGWAMLVKSAVALVLPAAFVLALVQRRQPAARLVVGYALAAVVSVAVMTPWIVRNYQVCGRFIPTMTVSGLAAFQGEYVVSHLPLTEPHFQVLEDASAEQDRVAAEMHLANHHGMFPMFYRVQDELAYYARLGRIAGAAYRARPALLLEAIGYNAYAFFFQGRTPRATMLNIVVTAPLLALVLWGAWAARRRGAALGLVLTCAGAFYAAHLPILAMARYYIPLWPLLAIPAAVGLADLLARARDLVGPARRAP